MRDIWNGIHSSKIIIAELTGRNPNVLYELGLCHALGKPVIIITQAMEDVPFDLKSLRCIVYNTSDPDWAKKLKNNLIKTLKRVLSNPESQKYTFIQRTKEKANAVSKDELKVKGREQIFRFCQIFSPPGMVLIPAGEFLMGSTEGLPDMKPLHKVYLDAYYIDKYEVTNEEFCQFLNEKGNQEEGGTTWININDDCLIEYTNGKYQPKPGYENYPVIEVSWYGACAYARWRGKRLPTEAEWEKAARGGLVGKKYPWGDSIDPDKANYGANIGEATPVGSYPSNGYGLYDMAGNVWEWCSDTYNENYYSKSPPRNPTGSPRGSVWVNRGGSWNSDARNCGSAVRFFSVPAFRCNNLGLRLVRLL